MTTRPSGITRMVEVHHPTKALLAFLSQAPTLLSALEAIAAGQATYKLALKWRPEPRAKKRKGAGR